VQAKPESNTSKNNFISPVNRIIIGDVGSGKTLVAISIALTFLKSFYDTGSQTMVAFLAPTEVLAYQHYSNLYQLSVSQSENLEFVDYLYLSGKKNQLNGQDIKTKELDKYIQNRSKNLFIVGTHAVLYKDWVTASLVMVDEQHRFGVRQRQKLITDYRQNHPQDFEPHYLSFSATPIPRTLALTFYSDLKPHFLEPLKHKKTIQTELKDFQELKEVFALISYRLEKQEKVFVICPQIEESESETEFPVWSVAKATKFFEKQFPGKVSSIHGKVKDKQKKLADFATSQDKSILVSTTVIEVGVDVAEATLMIILNAERFGLSSLHQIRGRIGRNSYDHNTCVLVTYPRFFRSQKLHYLKQYQNGFVLAEKDLEIRGSGDLLGSDQSGFSEDIQELMNLEIVDQKKLFELVNGLDYKNLDSNLPRLHKYLKQEQAKIWEE
jgi:ATP-dependent DNA helicase RecG